MLDLSRPLGLIENLVLYRDHQQENLVFFLPDEIGLKLTENGRDLSLQIFFEDAAIIGDSADLAEAVGSLLGLGAECKVSPERLEIVKTRLASDLERDDITLTPPPWETGRVELLLLDTRSGETDNGAIGEDPMVRGIAGRRQPSLSDGNLSALFHARLDRRATALTIAALEGRAGSLAGILYHLEFNALRPAVNLRMTADLDRVADVFEIGGGVTVYYVSADIQARFAELKESGVIKVDLVSEIADAETQRQVDEAVQDFYDTLMRELFRPTVPPMPTGAGVPGGGGTAQMMPVRFNFSYSRTEARRTISVDYRKRMARRRVHNPQAHLAELAGLAGGDANVIAKVALSDAWLEFRVEVAIPGGIGDSALLEVMPVIWRGRDGVFPEDQAREGGLRMPTGVSPLAEFGFSEGDAEPRHLLFVTLPDEPPFYYWQARMTFSTQEDVDSPSIIWSAPRTSSSADIDLFPQILAPQKEFRLILGAGHREDLLSITAKVSARVANGTEIASRVLNVTPQEGETRWAVRRPENLPMTLEVELAFHYEGGRTLRLPRQRVFDRELPADSPFAHTIQVPPLVIGATEDVMEVVLTLTYKDEETNYQHREIMRLPAPDFVHEDARIPVLRKGDLVAWEALAVKQSGETFQLTGGHTEGGSTLNLVITTDRMIRVEWLGGPLLDLGLRFVQVTLRAKDNGGLVVREETIEWRGNGGGIAPQTVTMPRDARVEWRMKKRFTDGQQETSDFETLVGDILPITP